MAEQEAVRSADSYSLALRADQGPLTTGQQTTLYAQLMDNSSPLAGVQVNFTVTGGDGMVGVGAASNSAITDSSGTASVTFYMGSTLSQVSVSDQGGYGTSSIEFDLPTGDGKGGTDGTTGGTDGTTGGTDGTTGGTDGTTGGTDGTTGGTDGTTGGTDGTTGGTGSTGGNQTTGVNFAIEDYVFSGSDQKLGYREFIVPNASPSSAPPRYYLNSETVVTLDSDILSQTTTTQTNNGVESNSSMEIHQSMQDNVDVVYENQVLTSISGGGTESVEDQWEPGDGSSSVMVTVDHSLAGEDIQTTTSGPDSDTTTEQMI